MSHVAHLVAFPEIRAKLVDRRQAEVTILNDRREVERRSMGDVRVPDNLLEKVDKSLNRERVDTGLRMINAAGIATLVMCALWTIHKVTDFTEQMPVVLNFISTTNSTLTEQTQAIRSLQLLSIGAASKDDLTREIGRLQVEISGAQTRLSLLEQQVHGKK